MVTGDKGVLTLAEVAVGSDSLCRRPPTPGPLHQAPASPPGSLRNTKAYKPACLN